MTKLARQLKTLQAVLEEMREIDKNLSKELEEIVNEYQVNHQRQQDANAEKIAENNELVEIANKLLDERQKIQAKDLAYIGQVTSSKATYILNSLMKLSKEIDIKTRNNVYFRG